jgi:phosphopantothenoylcysteine decarboxylase/phosphopantothenate--cysteine ligase
VQCIVTAGPTYEPLDEVRRLTNFSTGRLGCELANYLTGRGHQIVLLKGYYSVYQGETRAQQISTFTTTADLREQLRTLAQRPFNAVFHAAAVSDFGFGQIFTRLPSGDLAPVHSGKFSTGQGTLLAELVSTPKIIAEMRDWYASARLVGWKYEVDGTRDSALAAGRKQIQRYRTDACVVNGPAYGDGLGVIRKGSPDAEHVTGLAPLFAVLEDIVLARLDGL